MVRYPTSEVINGPVAHGTFLPPPGEMVKRKRTKGGRSAHRGGSVSLPIVSSLRWAPSPFLASLVRYLPLKVEKTSHELSNLG
jgi:hypothetical protein